jgi:hypothetical protein
MHTQPLSSRHEQKLINLLTALIDQQAARVLVPPYDASSGYWFGGGNTVRLEDGTLVLCGRYRNFGDSRTGVAAGARGLELALFESKDNGRTFAETGSWSKQDLSHRTGKVLSIEGAALLAAPDGGCELYVSTEKDVAYPEEVKDYQKPTTGVWSIDVFRGDDVNSLDVSAIQPALSEDLEPGYLHVKDPVPYATGNGDTVLVFCDHPFTWTSANTGYATRPADGETFTVQTWQMVGRGPAWDVAGTRITCRMPVPGVGAFADIEPLSVFFYDGLECCRQHEENPTAVKRPRGYSCEELGGALYGFNAEFPSLLRLSRVKPFFVSPWGTGCSRYVDVLASDDGLFATWQQSQEDQSQPLVGHFLDLDQVTRVLS